MKQTTEMQIQLQLHDFEDAVADNKFTFIPYGLNSDMSKEAVKVHVLHGRKRTNRGLGVTGVLQGENRNRGGYVFEWDSKVRSKPGGKRKGRQRESVTDNGVMGQTHVAYAVGVSGIRNIPCESAPRESVWDSRYLRNPFLDHLRDEYGAISSSRMDSTNYLVDHYLSRCGHSRFPRELLACYWQDTASLKAFLAHAATLFSFETGLPPPIHVEELICSTLQEIRQRLSDPVQKYADGTSMAVTILASLEEGRTHHEAAEFHWRGLKQLLRLRGDFSSLRQHRSLHNMVLWREIISSNSYDFCFGHGIHDAPELQHCTEHLIAVFNVFATELAEDGHLERKSNDVQLFIGTLVNRNIIRYCEWTHSMKKRSEIACLVYLATLVVSASGSVESRRMMESIKNEVIERDKWGQVSQEELLFVMLQKGDIEREWRCQQLWQISRCIFMTRKLNKKDHKTVRDLLSLFIGIEDGCDDKTEVLEAWNQLYKRLLREDGCQVELGECHVTGWAGVPKKEVQ